MSDSWKIAAFYHFVELPDRDEWAERMMDHGLEGGAARHDHLCAMKGLTPPVPVRTRRWTPPLRCSSPIRALQRWK